MVMILQYLSISNEYVVHFIFLNFEKNKVYYLQVLEITRHTGGGPHSEVAGRERKSLCAC